MKNTVFGIIAGSITYFLLSKYVFEKDELIIVSILVFLLVLIVSFTILKLKE